jgi:hypothetical protein
MEKAAARMRARRGRVSMGIDPEYLIDMADYGFGLICKGTGEFIAWSAKMREMFTEKDAEKYFRGAFDKAREEFRKEVQGDLAKETKPKKKKGKREVPDGEEEGGEVNLRQQIVEMFRAEAEAGVKDLETAVKNVYEALVYEMPDLNERTVRDVFTEYGKTRQPNPEEIATRLREWRAVGQKLSQLEDAWQGILPRKSGTQREPPTQRIRDLTKQVIAAMKEMGLDAQGREARKKSALDAAKTRLRNQIEDLTKAIATRKPIVKTKTGIQYDAETKSLMAQRDELQAKYEEVFGKPELTDAQRLNLAIQAAERNAKMWEDRLANAKRGVFKQPKISARKLPPSMKLDEILQRTADARNGIDRLKQEGEPSFMDLERVRQYKARLDKMIASGEKRLKEGDFAVRKRKPVNVSEDPEALEKQAKVAEIRQKIKAGQERDRWSKLTWIEKSFEVGVATYDVVRDIAASTDDSIIGRQGIFLMYSHPVKWAKNILPTLQAMSPKQSRRFGEQWKERENHRNGLDAVAKVEYNIPDGRGNFPTGTDETFGVNLIRYFPVIKQDIEISNRVFGTGANLQRSALLDFLIANSKIGREIMQDPKHLTEKQRQYLEDIGQAVNILTGRGTMKGAQGLSRVFWAPRFVKALFQTLFLRPIFNAKTPEARAQIAVEYMRAVASVAAIYGTAMMFADDDHEIEPDPRSSAWGAIPLRGPLEGITWNPLGAIRPQMNIVARTISGQTKVGKKVINLRKHRDLGFGISSLPFATEKQRRQKVPYKTGMKETISRYTSSKLHPAISAIMNALAQEDYYGQDQGPMDALFGAAKPITPGQMYEAFQLVDPKAAAAVAAGQFFGFDVDVEYMTRQKAAKKQAKKP